MGRPKSFDRDKAIEIVMHEIWQQGYEACSVKAISEKLGITRSSFYNTFGSREALFFEVLDVYFQQSPDSALANIKSGDSVIKNISAVFEAACRARTTDKHSRGCMAVNSVAELVGNHDIIGPKLEQAIQNSIKRFESLLSLAAEQGEIENDNIATKALALQNLLIGLNVLSKVVTNFDELWQPTKHTLKGLGIYTATR